MTKFTIASWNVNSINVRLPHISQWLVEHQPDVLAVQETKTPDEKFPLEGILETGYDVVYSGQKTYNGVAMLTKNKAQGILKDIPQLADPQRRILVATVADIRIINLYVPNGETVDSEKYHYKLDWLAKITEFVKQQLMDYSKLIVLGDFNIAPEDRDVYDPKRWQGKVLCSELERKALQQLLAVGLQDSFRLFDQADKSYSWWDYRMMGFRRNHGLRIDHVLVSDALAKKTIAATIDKTPRGWERPSDHAPVVTVFDL